MDKLCDKMDKAMERCGMGGRKTIASGELERVAGNDGHGPRKSGKFSELRSPLADLKPKRNKGAY